jgi:hypothetical protein
LKGKATSGFLWFFALFSGMKHGMILFAGKISNAEISNFKSEISEAQTIPPHLFEI